MPECFLTELEIEGVVEDRGLVKERTRPLHLLLQMLLRYWLGKNQGFGRLV
jgi:hypothetical protein